jgi:hypothetical protein
MRYSKPEVRVIEAEVPEMFPAWVAAVREPRAFSER